MDRYLEIDINWADEVIIFIQINYIKDQLKKYCKEEFMSAPTHMTAVRLKRERDRYICKPKALKDYQTLLEKIMHYMVKTRLDLAYFVF